MRVIVGDENAGDERFFKLARKKKIPNTSHGALLQI